VLTGRLDLRAVAAGDLDALHPILAAPENFVHIPGGARRDRAATLAWIERYSGRWQASGLGYWTVRLRAGGTVIGAGGAERRPQFWNLYYLLDRAHWGHGYGTELARAAQRAARQTDPDLPLAAWIHSGNLASQAVARHLGLTDYGLREAAHWNALPMHYWADRAPDANRPGV
jgi:RimJ/RimL family protein N-acetyltransferase